MGGEDVYDVAVPEWCTLCNAPHMPCHEDYLNDLDYECYECHGRLSDRRYNAGIVVCSKCERKAKRHKGNIEAP